MLIVMYILTVYDYDYVNYTLFVMAMYCNTKGLLVKTHLKFSLSQAVHPVENNEETTDTAHNRLLWLESVTDELLVFSGGK